jgi:hypothetical protein
VWRHMNLRKIYRKIREHVYSVLYYSQRVKVEIKLVNSCTRVYYNIIFYLGLKCKIVDQASNPAGIVTVFF